MRTLSRYCLSFLLLLACQLSLAAPVIIEASGQKIMTASAVRVRIAPDTRADEVGKLDLGTLVAVEQQTKDKQQIGSLFNYWFKVTAGELSGWVFGDFLIDFKAADQDKIWAGIAQDRLGKKEMLFTDWTDLYRFAEQALTQAKSETTIGWLELARLSALQGSFAQINFQNEKESPYMEWLAAHKGKVYNDEISAMWLLPAEKLWTLADKHAYSKLGDDIAWAAASAQLGGECEGDVECNLRREGMTTIEYLQRYPTGDHVAEALAGLEEVLIYLVSALKQEPDYFRVMPEMLDRVKRYIYTVEKTCGDQALRRGSVITQLKVIESYIP